MKRAAKVSISGGQLEFLRTLARADQRKMLLYLDELPETNVRFLFSVTGCNI